MIQISKIVIIFLMEGDVVYKNESKQRRNDFFQKKFAGVKILCIFALVFKTQGSIAQLVQSICLTSRGSGVRIPLLPPSHSLVAFLI